jgi:hypothetical protein
MIPWRFSLIVGIAMMVTLRLDGGACYDDFISSGTES